MPRLEGMNVLVVDDVAPARLRLTDLLRQDLRITSMLEASNGLEAVRDRLRPARHSSIRDRCTRRPTQAVQ